MDQSPIQSRHSRYDLHDRQAQYNAVQLISIVAASILAIVGVFSAVLSIHWLFYLSYILLVILGLVYNIFFFRQLDWTEMRRRSSFATPGVVLCGMVVITVYAVFSAGTQALSSVWARMAVSAVITFVLGVLSFSLPLTQQRKALDLAAKSRTIKSVLSKVETSLDELGRQMVLLEQGEISESEKVEKTATELDVTREAVKLIALVMYRETLKDQTKSVDYFRYLSPLIGPIVSALVSLLVK